LKSNPSGIIPLRRMYAEQDPTQNHNGQKMDVLSIFFLINK